MARTKKQEEVWITAKEAMAILRRNSGRDDIDPTYIRTLARAGKVQTKELDGRTNGYLLSDIENYRVQRRDQGKGQSRKARADGEPRSAAKSEKEETIA